MSIVSFIVMETGSEWPGHVGDLENLVVVDDNNESTCRVRYRLDALRASGLVIRVGVLACNSRIDAESRTRRATMARELLSAVAGTGFGRLVLTAGRAASTAARTELRALQEELRATSSKVMVHIQHDV
jgi:hypothetical protein